MKRRIIVLRLYVIAKDQSKKHNRLSLYLLALIKSCDGILEPTLDQLITQLSEVGGLLNHWLTDHLTNRLASLSSPDDLFNFFSDLRGILSGPDTTVMDDDQISLDPTSNLGVYVRRCLLAFNVMSFEGVCHLLTNIGAYCKEALSTTAPYELPRSDDFSNAPETVEYENMDLENLVFEKVNAELESRKRSYERVSFHNHAPRALFGLVEDINVTAEPKLKNVDKNMDCSPFSQSDKLGVDASGGNFLRTNWQVQGYLLEQADLIEKHRNSFSLNSFESILKQLQKQAPELHRVHFLQYLNSLYHDDYPLALENLHRYFDYSAGTEGCDLVTPTTSCNSFGRYENALLCLGMMHFHFGHPKEALEVLTEAVRVSQQYGDDTCLAYTISAICNLLSEIGISDTTGIIGSSYSHVTSIGTSLSIQEQLFVLLRRSLKRAESLKLKRLVASSHLAMARFDLTHVQRPLLSFGPKASMKLRTFPVNVCKDLRFCSRLISEFDTESELTITDGAMCTAWLENLKKPAGSTVFFQDNGSGIMRDGFQFCAQPSSVPASVQQLVGSSYLVRATAWETYGSAPLARISALVFASCFAKSSSSEDIALAYAKLIRHIAVFKGYKEAFNALKIAEEKFLSVSKSRILLLKLQLLHERALHKGNLKRAQQLCDELGVLASSVTGVDMDMKAEASLRSARTLLAANQYSEAAAVAHTLFCMCYKFNMQVENATVLLLLAEIHKKSGNAVLGIPFVLASISFCQLFNLDLLKASAALTLAELWLSLGSTHAKRAVTLIHGALPIILGHGGLELRGRAFIAEAKCYLSDPSFSVIDNPEVVLDPLSQASEEFEVLEYHELAAEAFYLLAIVHNKLGQSEEREEAAASFKKHIIALETPVDKDHFLFDML
ncbi:Anaphase-promoting complex subunit 5 [Heracleum sosnowskyi]|uniref:Anaphase-promoting complex subunit 5 n=1 Tax=Heracleum sosnowskyi TaxID=360622 RepID=A0AAD8J770_9APIA|nr:Anaphase-promoting complex subunit 5 [Heracleum sosnowskyi]